MLRGPQIDDGFEVVRVAFLPPSCTMSSKPNSTLAVAQASLRLCCATETAQQFAMDSAAMQQAMGGSSQRIL
eukprot:symbB.v1.2.006367.t1/scaffold371.1/size308833/14